MTVEERKNLPILDLAYKLKLKDMSEARPKDLKYEHTGDCYLCAISSLLNIDYREVYKGLADIAYPDCLLPNDSMNVIPKYLYEHHRFITTYYFKRISEYYKEAYVKDIIEWYSDEELLICIPKHMVAYRDGIIHDKLFRKDFTDLQYINILLRTPVLVTFRRRIIDGR